MNAAKLIKTVQSNGHLELNLPDFCNQQIEIIIFPLEQHLALNEPLPLATQQIQSGFAQVVLTDPAEDIWNEL